MKQIRRILAALLALLCLSVCFAAAESAAVGAALETPLPDPVNVHAFADLPWYLTLVNASHGVPENWSIPAFTELKHGQRVDSRIYPQLQKMFDDARAEGLLPMVLTSYRTYEDQKAMLIKKYRRYKEKGMSKAEAQAAALQVAAYPGYSEHQLGIAVDIDSADEERCSNDQVWDWMKRHCQNYGFIWRYPGVKSEITGISNESWHFRYVGVEAATYIMQNRLCLEEYLEQVYGLK